MAVSCSNGLLVKFLCGDKSNFKVAGPGDVAAADPGDPPLDPVEDPVPPVQVAITGEPKVELHFQEMNPLTG